MAKLYPLAITLVAGIFLGWAIDDFAIGRLGWKSGVYMALAILCSAAAAVAVVTNLYDHLGEP